MRKFPDAVLACRLLQIFWILLAVFHILLLFHVLPMRIAWGGRITRSSQGILLESTALLITVLFLAIVSVKLHLIRVKKKNHVIRAGIWIIFAYLLLNTVGNLASAVSSEKLIFAPLTLMMSLLALRLAVEK